MPRPKEPLLAELPDAWVGDRVVVRPYREDDASTLFRAINESRDHLRRWLPWPDQHQRVEETLAFIRRAQGRWVLRESVDVGIFTRDGGELLGGTGLHLRDWSIGYFEIGYWIRQSAEGNGYVAEAVKLLASFAFANWDAVRVEIRCDAQNARSAHVAERLGFVYEGTLRKSGPAPDGQLRDTMIFALTCDDFGRVKDGWSVSS